MIAPIIFKMDRNVQKNVVKKYRRRKKNRKRTRGLLPWWFERKYKNHIRKTKSFFSKNESINTMIFKHLCKEMFNPMFKFVRNEDKFRSKPKVYDIRRFELSRVINGFRKRKFYHGRRYTEYNNAKPIYQYAAQETIFVPNRNVSRYIYTKFFSDNTLQLLRKKNKRKWTKKVVRPSIFFKQHFKSLKKTFRVKEKIRKYKLLTRFRSSTSWIKKSARWKDFQSKFPLIKSTDKDKKAMRWTIFNSWKKGVIKRKKGNTSYKWMRYFDRVWKKISNYEALVRVAPIIEADEEEDLIEEVSIIKPKKKVYSKFPINFGDPRKLSNILFYKFYHEHYTSKERIVSIYKNSKYSFIRKNKYRIPHLFAFMHDKYRVKVGLKKVINFYKELPILKPYFTKDTEFFYSICFPNKLNYETQTNKINKYKIYLDQSVNFFFKKYYHEVLNNYSSKIYSTIEEHNLVKERFLEAYLSRTASRIWYWNKSFFKFHRICKATLNKKYRKILKRKRPERKRLIIKAFRTFIGDESFRQVRINTNWHDRIEKRRKHPISYFLWKHTLTERFSKHHRIYKNRIKYFSLDNKRWKANDWLGLFHYFRRRIKKRRKKIITKVYFKYPRTSTVRDAKVNLSKGTITYAKKTRTYHGRFLKVKLRWKKTRYRRYLKNHIKRWVFYSNIDKII